MQIEAFKVYRDLVETKSFSKAAQLNNVTQSAVSQQIRTIELRFGLPMIERTSKKFHLTAEGEMLYESSKKLLEIYDELKHRFDELRNVVSGTIRVATVYSIGLYSLQPYTKAFIKLYPTVNLRVEFRRSNQVYEDVLDGLADIGITAFPMPHRNIQVEPFIKDRLVLVCSPNHPLAQKSSAVLQDVTGSKFVGFEPDIPTRKAIDKWFRGIGLDLSPIMEFDNVETVKRAVEIDSGVSILPEVTVQNEIKSGALIAIPLTGGDYVRPVGIIYRSGRVLSPAIRKFLEILKTDTARLSQMAGT